MSDYKKYRESHLRAQKKYDAKNKEKRREYDKKRWQKKKHLETNWNELKKWLEERIDYLTEIDGQHIPLNDSFEFCSMNELYQTGKYSGLKDSLEKMQELENRKV